MTKKGERFIVKKLALTILKSLLESKDVRDAAVDVIVKHLEEGDYQQVKKVASPYEYVVEANEIVGELNTAAGKKFKATGAKTRSLIRARLNEGYTVQDFKFVISKKVKDWMDNKKMSGYLRPETLFGSKFEGYLNEANTGFTIQPNPSDRIKWDLWFYGLTSEERARLVLTREVTSNLDEYMDNGEDMKVFKKVATEMGIAYYDDNVTEVKVLPTKQ